MQPCVNYDKFIADAEDSLLEMKVNHQWRFHGLDWAFTETFHPANLKKFDYDIPHGNHGFATSSFIKMLVIIEVIF